MRSKHKSNQPPICVLCEREVGYTTKHHLIPRTVHRNKWFRKKFTREQMNETIPLCSQCHKGIHDFIPEKEMGKQYNSLEKLKTHEKVIGLIQWLNRNIS